MEIKSHVQMPKGLMKAFSHRTENGRCVYYLDLKDMEIKEEKINELGTIKGLYDPTSEAILDRLYESPFFEAILNVKKFTDGKLETLSFNQREEEALINFLKISIMRSNATRQKAEKTSLVASIFPDVYKAALIPTMHLVMDEIPLLNGYHINILINKSKLRLVAPRNCVAFSFKDNILYYTLPLSPQVAILYQPDELYRLSFDDKGNLCYALAEEGDEEIIQSINLAAGINEKDFNNEFLIGAGREELEILKRDLSGEST